MPLAPHTIKPARRSSRKKKRVGRGNSSGKGTYSGRGLKGQKSRSGGKRGLKRRGFKQSLQKVPKVRGFKSVRSKAQTVTLRVLEKIAEEGKEINPLFLEQKGAIKSSKNPIKIVATGKLKKKLEIKGCLASRKAIQIIEKLDGNVSF